MGGGNLGAQKYEARRNMELFQAAVHEAKPSRETAAWRDGTKKLYKRVDGRKLMKEKIQQKENLELGKKIFDIHHEPRRKATREYVPGWRIGNISGGMCIDCYATDNPLVKVFAELHNFKEKRKAIDKRIAVEDAELKKHIAMYSRYVPVLPGGVEIVYTWRLSPHAVLTILLRTRIFTAATSPPQRTRSSTTTIGTAPASSSTRKALQCCTSGCSCRIRSLARSPLAMALSRARHLE